MLAKSVAKSVIGESFQEMLKRTLGGSSITQYVYVDLDFRWPGGSSSLVPQVSATMSFNTIAEAVFMDTVKPMTGFGSMIDLGQIINGIVDLGFNMSRAVKRRLNGDKGGEADNTTASESSSYITDTRTAQCQECCKQINKMHNNHAVDCHTNRPTQLDKTRCRYVHTAISEFLGSNRHTTKWWLTKIGSRRKLSVEKFHAMIYGNFDNVQEYILASCDENDAGTMPWCQAEKMCQHMAVSCFGGAEEDGAVVEEDSDNDDNDGRRRVGGGADAGQHDQCVAQARAHFPPATFHVAPQAKDGTCFFHSITKGLTGRTNGGHESAAANPYSRAALVAHLASAANQRAAPFGRPTYPGDTVRLLFDYSCCVRPAWCAVGAVGDVTRVHSKLNLLIGGVSPTCARRRCASSLTLFGLTRANVSPPFFHRVRQYVHLLSSLPGKRQEANPRRLDKLPRRPRNRRVLGR